MDFSPPKYFAEIPRSSTSLFRKSLSLLILGIPTAIKEWFTVHTHSEIAFTLLIGCAVACYLLFWPALYLWLVLAGFVVGYVVCAPNAAPDLIYSIHKQVHSALLSPHCTLCKEEARKGRTQERPVRLNLPNPLHDTVVRILQLVVRDFIDDWYVKVNTFTRERKFQSSIFNLLKSVINNFLLSFRTRIPADISATLTSSFCILTQRHVKQYKKYARLCSKGEFLKAKDILALSHAKEREYLNRISEIIFCHLIPAEEKGGEVAALFTKDLIGNVLIYQLVDLLSEPDFINQLIVDYLDFERQKLYLKTRKGYCLLRIKLFKARNLVISTPNHSSSSNSDHLHVTFVMCDKKLKSKKKKAAMNVEFQEEFRFKIPDNIAKHDLDNSVVVSLKETNMFKVNEYIGTCEFFPLLMNQNECIRGWHSLTDGTTGEVVGELDLEYSIIKFPDSASAANGSESDVLPVSEESFFMENASESIEEESSALSLSHVINNHEFFLEFFNFLASQKAQSFMHLWVSIDSFLKNASFDQEAIDVQTECKCIFNSHFDSNFSAPDYLIPADNAPLQQFHRQITHQTLTSAECLEVLRQTQDYLFALLEDFYFPLFRCCAKFKELQVRYYREQHEALLANERHSEHSIDNAGQEEQMPKNVHNSTGTTGEGEFNFSGCKIDCRLIANSPSSSETSLLLQQQQQQQQREKNGSEHFLNALFHPVSVILGSVVGNRSSNLSFCIEVSLRYPIVQADLTLSSYSIVRTHFDLHQMHRALKKRFIQVSALTFPSKKSIGSNEEKRRQLEYQMRVYLEAVVQHECICEAEPLRKLLLPNAQEKCKLFGQSTSTLQQQKKNPSLLRRLFSSSVTASTTKQETNAALGTMSVPSLKITKAESINTASSAPKSFNDDEGCSIHSVESATSEDQVDVFLDSLFALLTETFDISGRGQWIKRQILNALKHLLKQTRSGSVKSLIDNEIVSRFSTCHLNCYLVDLERLVWPEGKLPEQKALPTVEEREARAAQAKAVLLKIVPDALATVIGRGKVLISLSRLFLMLQYQEYNKILVYEMLIEALEVLLVGAGGAVECEKKRLE